MPNDHDIREPGPGAGAWRLKPLAVLTAALLLTACASETQRREGMALVMDGHYEQGLSKLEQALKTDPENTTARRDFLRQREQIVNRILGAAGSERALEHYDAAEAQYHRALAIDPSNAAAKNGLLSISNEKRHNHWLADAQALVKKGDVAGARRALEPLLVEDPGNVKANQLRYALAEQNLRENIAGPTLNIKGRKPITLQFRDANLKMVLDAISRTTSLNILVDKDVRNDIKVTIFVKDTPVEETLDLILMQNQLEKRVLGENTVLIYPFNASKTKDYQELKVRRFALTNADPKQVQSMLKTLLKTKDVFVDEKTNAVMIRDTVQAIRLAEKMVASMDQPEAEVMIELELLDISRNRSLELGIDWPTAASAMLPSSMTLDKFRQRSAADVTVSASPSGVAIKALESDGDTRVLANPRIRARSKDKARIMIGSRTPIISSAAVPNTTGAAAVYNTNIQYLDTGIKLEVEPMVYLNNEVAIKLNMEVSDLADKFQNDQTGTLAYATTTNAASTVLRLRDGETQVLAGLVRAFTNSSAAQKIPGLGDIPLIGRLFGINSDSWQNREIVLAVTPHIVRNNQETEADLLELWSGTESNIKATESNLKVPGTSGVINQALPGTARATPLAPQPAAVAEMAADPGMLSASLAGPQQARVGDKISIELNTRGAAGVSAVTLVLQYDPETLKPLAVTEGDLLRRAGVQSAFESNIDEGGAKVSASLSAQGGGKAGSSGSVAHVQFEVIGSQAPARVSVASLTASGESGAGMPLATPLALSIALQP